MSAVPAIATFGVGLIFVCWVQEQDVPFVVPLTAALVTACVSTALLALTPAF